MILEVVNGTYGYGKGVNLFSNLNFKVNTGEILTILGPNGVGKTTLLKCILGLFKWRKGNTLINNLEADKITPSQFWKDISYVPQGKNMIFPYTVLEMVLMGRAPYLGAISSPRREDVNIAKRAIEEVGISRLMYKSCGAISGGELQLVLIARALTSDPKILVLDEPESNLDMKNQLLVLQIIEKLKKEKNISCIINTHYPNHALRISNNTLMLGGNGRHLFGKTYEIITEKNIKRFFGVKTRIIELETEREKAQMLFPVELANEI
ncbi:ABC transporter ATP-binding protein [Paramaledivibacter caminithermalis]|jgi:iron complex transport system ATP-binding protein|uniref:Iron complex transport system ATP-binding protein n=1 Tax=Paramaledivibacter caminithermalis (strain DSM 15212 / CIP 107654 / DViRD3) TaxID=1121301 RepID=A0A1M6P2L9_PARC5|nr:ABC transporter ATP-binding protein [Paramaledivibacter caminithermalis]SHK02209.1 iron complex transport system ATP-binding protein [Paramaledivibacter caminithermalis DSM 15212]